ncbi:VOC family protein [Bacillus sp. B15-48]|uniref:VOC family protein n=1 Tax=Bacillus sp. B15-48 TaxID=1548601 RepID=UPI0019400770|nr:VOC family protein [Bacillus sp. B15-48]MBM4761873.1 VOC family protein [Bacillus sp. B15-48]
MSINVYITFNGNCREAVELYSEAFATEKPQIMTFGDAPPNPEFELPVEAKELVMHTELYINGSRVMFSDVFPGQAYEKGNNITLAFVSEDLEAVKHAFSKLKEQGTVEMELQETFWSKCYGKVTDRFGIGWQVSLDGDK